MASTLRFLRHYLRPPPGAVRVREIAYRREGESLPAALYSPAGRERDPLPSWVVLHGLTCAGRRHTSLDRFARAIAASGTLVMVPEIPEWTRLRIAPRLAVPTIRAAILGLSARDDTADGRIGVLGFSFGATQALVAAVDERLEGHLAGITAWGGYHDPYSTLRFGLTGEHELDGARHRLEPDPYARWMMAANYLTCTPGHEEADDVADALHALALDSGSRGVSSRTLLGGATWRRVRASVAPGRRPLFDLLAPPADGPPRDLDRARELATDIAAAAVRTDPLLDPKPILPRVAVPTVLAHARDDRLVPYTESIRLSRALPQRICSRCTVTALFAHAGGARPDLGPLGMVTEAVRFTRVLHRMLALP